MAYVQGRWVYTENSQEVHYSLVHPSAVCLPANGDYTAYTAWGKTIDQFYKAIKQKILLDEILLCKNLVGHQAQQCKLNVIWVVNLVLLSNNILCSESFCCAYRLYEIVP